MKHILSVGLAMGGLCLLTACGQPAVQEEDLIDKQLQLLTECREQWIQNEEGEVYGYAVTDLDHNGRMELIASSCRGTGIYTYSNFFEVNEAMDGLTLCTRTLQEGDSQADFLNVNAVPVYYDSAQDIYYYILDDTIKNGAAEYYENKRALYLQNQQIQELPLAYKETIYTNAEAFTTTYTDADGNAITEAQYDAMAETTFADLEQHTADLQWIAFDAEELQALEAQNLYNLLSESYHIFAEGYPESDSTEACRTEAAN